MENYELNISAPPKRKNNWFQKGNIPFNKGIPQNQWMDGRKIKRVKKYLELGRKKGNIGLADHNRIPIVGIKNGKLYSFESSVTAARILKAKGIKINARNIRTVCAGTINKFKFGKYEYNYIRRRAGGFQWFFASDVEKYKNLIY